MNLCKQKTLENLAFETVSTVSNPSVSDNESLINEIQEDMSPKKNVTFTNDENKSADTLMNKSFFSSGKTKFQSLKAKLNINKTKSRLENKQKHDVIDGYHSSSISESVTKSPRSNEKRGGGGGSSERTVKDYWILFHNKFFDSEEIKLYKKKQAKKELKVLSESFFNVHEMFNFDWKVEENQYLIIEFSDVIVKCLQYLHYWKEKKADKRNIIHLCKLIIQTLKDSKDELKRRNLQILIEKLQGLKILLILIWEEDENDYAYIHTLIDCLIVLFEGDPINKYIQKATYEFFISNPNSEIFFSKISEIVKFAININRSNKNNKNAPIKTLKKLLFKLMRLFQLFCEGHNLELQNYLANQTNSKNSFDMLGLITTLVNSYLICEENYDIIDQCYDTLSEFIQVIYNLRYNLIYIYVY